MNTIDIPSKQQIYGADRDDNTKNYPLFKAYKITWRKIGQDCYSIFFYGIAFFKFFIRRWHMKVGENHFGSLLKNGRI